MGYAAAVAVYEELSTALHDYELAKEERIRVERECAEAVELIRQYRRDMSRDVENYLATHDELFNRAFDAMDQALISNDIDGYLTGNAEIQESLGYLPRFRTQQEFDDLMASDDNFVFIRRSQLMKYIKTRDALQAFYYLIAVDGSVRDDERALFDHIGDNLDAKHFHDYRKEIIDSCDERINQCHDSDDRYDVIVEGVDAVLSHRTDKRAAGIAPRLLLWNMLSVAFADGEYDAVESRLIKHIARTMIADRSIYPEMEHLMRAAYDVRGELDWISNSELPYSEVRPMVDQLEERVNVLQNAAVLLIEDETAAPAPEVMVPEKDVFDQTKDAVDSVVAPVVDQVQQGAQGAADAVKHTFDNNVAPVLNQVGDALKPVNDAVLKPVGNAANEVAKRAGDAANEVAKHAGDAANEAAKRAGDAANAVQGFFGGLFGRK